MRLVMDASICVEFLLGTTLGARAAPWVTKAESLHAPDLLVSEIVSALRGLMRGGTITDAEARLTLRSLAGTGIDLVSALPLVPSVWSLAARHSTYDAHYLALAGGLPATLLTADAKLARAASGIEVVLLERPAPPD